MKKTVALALAATALTAGSQAHAATVIVNALTHSFNSGAGTPLSTILLTAGQSFSISSSLLDTWSAGPDNRISNGNGLTGDTFAQAGDDSGRAPGTQIGQDFGLLTFGSFSAPYGSLVGRIGSDYYLLGANSTATALGSGALELFYWDTFTADNSGEITFNVNAVPEPGAWGLMLIGFGLIGYAMRGRQRTRVSFA